MAYEFMDNCSVLVTGGTGSFGQKFVHTLLAESKVRRIIIFSRDELKQSRMKQQISDPEKRLRFFIGDVRDLERLERAFEGVDYVVHAAALKQVPALEYNPFEAVKTNVLGTQNVINAALNRGVKKVVLVSTDKAAHPANLYGATKLCAERLITSSNVYSGDKGTKLAAVRYGNVFGSRGSLVDVINEQRAKGEIDITHEEMTRFWITLDEGVRLVLMALEKMHGGEIFVPKIPSMNIKRFIEAIAPECKLKVIGIRPGEKLHEVLVTTEEARHTKEYPKYYVIVPEHDWVTETRYADGTDVPVGFYFSSDTNTVWVTEDDIKRLLASV